MKYEIEIKGKTKYQVTKLNLSRRGLTEFPENIFDYTNLTKLVLSNNRIKSIPKEILTLKKLKVLDLANNDIKVLQGAVFKLPKLRTLNVYGNRIEKFPKQLADSKIGRLIVGRNSLSEDEIKRISRICKDVVVNEAVSEEAEAAGAEAEDMSVTVVKEKKMEKHSIFISYSHKDKEWLEKVKTHLKPLNRYYGIEEWDDGKLRTSDKWKEEISKALNSATIAVLLFSPDFVASDFIINNELQPLLENAAKRGVKIMPVMVRPCATFEESGLSDYQAANGPDKTLIEMNAGEVDRTLTKLVSDIRAMVTKK